ncbi:hypothetical protein [Streptomyces camelliae]|uniref:Uncharacterized protein n=1 Tax=Streptomyces camelliae TaxID=3004093 RepID=A0ABY7P5B3_9ACTN|nr:hypothetical protein [Streptomyces sp. HUAS 2-6]WBO65572.1 hypothetical protein O1G22_23510 [Streptomyces sp. HUAS 2-6]
MGDTFQTIVDLDATAAEAPRLAGRVLDLLVAEGIVLAERADRSFGHHLPGPRWDRAVDPGDARWKPTDGLTVITGRTVFHGGQGEADWARCPRCTATIRLYTEEYDRIDAAWEPYGRAMDRWDETGEADVDCPACATAVPLPEWTWAWDYFAFGHLGFEFWNWPEFTEEFGTLIADALDGHRTVRVWGKF